MVLFPLLCIFNIMGLLLLIFDIFTGLRHQPDDDEEQPPARIDRFNVWIFCFGFRLIKKQIISSVHKLSATLSKFSHSSAHMNFKQAWNLKLCSCNINMMKMFASCGTIWTFWNIHISCASCHLWGCGPRVRQKSWNSLY